MTSGSVLFQHMQRCSITERVGVHVGGEKSISVFAADGTRRTLLMYNKIVCKHNLLVCVLPLGARKKIVREGLAVEQELPTRIWRFPQIRTCKCLSIHCGKKYLKSGVISPGSTEPWVNQYTTGRPRSRGRIHLHVKCQRSAYNYVL